MVLITPALKHSRSAECISCRPTIFPRKTPVLVTLQLAGFFFSGIYSSAQIVKNFTVSASAVGDEARAFAYAFHSHSIIDEERDIINYGTLVFERGISGNISVTASSKKC